MDKERLVRGNGGDTELTRALDLKVSILQSVQDLFSHSGWPPLPSGKGTFPISYISIHFFVSGIIPKDLRHFIFSKDSCIRLFIISELAIELSGL